MIDLRPWTARDYAEMVGRELGWDEATISAVAEDRLEDLPPLELPAWWSRIIGDAVIEPASRELQR